MTGHWSNTSFDDPPTAPAAGALIRAFFGALAVALTLTCSAFAQEPQVPAGTNPPATPAPDPAARPGFFDALGRWFAAPKAVLDWQLKTTGEALGSATDAAGALVGLPNARMVRGRERCPASANGAPDCNPAADALCRAKGFESGRGVDVNSARKCPARAWLSGRVPGEHECVVETFVTSAVCQ